MAHWFVEIIKPLGFDYVTLDLEGYRTGSLNAQIVAFRKVLHQQSRSSKIDAYHAECPWACGPPKDIEIAGVVASA